MKALKIEFEISNAESIHPDFVEKVLESREQYKKGEYISVQVDKKEYSSCPVDACYPLTQ